MRLAFVLLLAACGSKAQEADTGACTGAVAHAQSISEKAMPPGVDPKMADRMKAMMAAATKAMTDACAADKWSPEVVTCLQGAGTNEDLMKCQKLLTPEQSANVTKAVTQATSAIKSK